MFLTSSRCRRSIRSADWTPSSQPRTLDMCHVISIACSIRTRSRTLPVGWEGGRMSNPLRFDVYVSAQIPVVTNDLPPGVSERRWSPISSTLISGKRDAVLVDTFITLEQNRPLVDWIAASGKNLTTIYATHGHGDHFFGVNMIRARYPQPRFGTAPD